MKCFRILGSRVTFAPVELLEKLKTCHARNFDSNIQICCCADDTHFSETLQRFTWHLLPTDVQTFWTNSRASQLLSADPCEHRSMKHITHRIDERTREGELLRNRLL